MKIRNGFVSNSSSSSFCIYGVSLDTQEFRDLMLKKFSQLIDEDTETYEIEEILDTNKIVHPIAMVDGESDLVFLGASPQSCPDNKTMGEFKKETEKEIIEFIGKDLGIEWINHDYYC